jgi:hypothetical protein
VSRHVAQVITRLVVDYFPSRRLVVDYITYIARPVASARRAACRVTHRRLLRLAQARRQLLRLHRAFGSLGTSRGSSRGSSSTTSPPPRIRLLRHVARLVARLVDDYFASRRLVIDYFTYAARQGASARRAACHAARRRLLHLRRASGCFGTSRGSSRGLSLTTSPQPRVRLFRHVARLVAWLIARLVVDYFTSAVRPGASARRAARRAARHRLLRLRRVSGCFSTSHGSSRCSSSTTLPRAGSSSTTSPTPRVRVPRHVARLVTRLVVDYSVCRDIVLRPHWLYFSHVVRRDYLSRDNNGSTSTTSHAVATSSFGRIASTIHLD